MTEYKKRKIVLYSTLAACIFTFSVWVFLTVLLGNKAINPMAINSLYVAAKLVAVLGSFLALSSGIILWKVNSKLIVQVLFSLGFGLLFIITTLFLLFGKKHNKVEGKMHIANEDKTIYVMRYYSHAFLGRDGISVYIHTDNTFKMEHKLTIKSAELTDISANKNYTIMKIRDYKDSGLKKRYSIEKFKIDHRSETMEKLD